DARLNPDVEAAKYLKPPFTTPNGDNPGVPDVKAALEGARHILVEQFSEDAELIGRLREHISGQGVLVSTVAEGKEEAGANLHDLLLAAPAGPRATIGLDPGLRTGVKVAVVDRTGKVVETAAIFPHAPRNDWDGALHTLAVLAYKHQAELISIGNGTASRETD